MVMSLKYSRKMLNVKCLPGVDGALAGDMVGVADDALAGDVIDAVGIATVSSGGVGAKNNIKCQIKITYMVMRPAFLAMMMLASWVTIPTVGSWPVSRALVRLVKMLKCKM